MRSPELLLGGMLSSLVGLAPANAGVARFALLDAIDRATATGSPAVAGPSAYSSPYRVLPKRLARFVSIITLPIDPVHKAFDMREALALGPRASITFPIPALASATFSAAAFSRNGDGEIDLALSDGDGAAVGAPRRMPLRFRASRTSPRPAWVSLRAALEMAASTRRLTISNQSDRPVWIANPALIHDGEPDDRPPPTNIVLVMVDTLTAEAVGHLGAHGITPELDRLAKSGVAFENAVTNANWTRPATLNLLGGDYSSAFGINVHSWKLDFSERRALYASRPDTIPLLARRSGRDALAIGNNLFVMGYHAAGVDVGFDRVLDFRTDVQDTVDIGNEVERFFAGHQGGPFFLYVPLNAPHHPYQPPRECLAKVQPRPGEKLHDDVRRYLGEVAYTDVAIGRIARAIEKSRVADRTVLVITADHGEGLREDNAYLNVVFSRYSRFTHTINLYDEVVRVPLVFVGPGLAKGVRVKDQVRLLDVPPTIADLMGVPQRSHRGESLAAALRGDAIRARPAYTEGKRMSSIRAGDWKYIRREKGYDVIQPHGRGPARAVPEELYDLTRDPRETRNLVSQDGEKLKEMRALWQKLRDEAAARPSARVGAVAPPSSTAPHGPAKRPTNTTILLNSDGATHEVLGEIRTNGRIVDWHLEAAERGAGVWLADPRRLLVALVARSKGARLRVATEPADAALELSLTFDGRPLDRRHLRVGRFGLPLFDTLSKLEGEDLDVLYSARPPVVVAGREAGVFVWRDSRFAGAEVADDGHGSGADALEGGVLDAMRAWGYVQDPGKPAKGDRRRGNLRKKGDLE